MEWRKGGGCVSANIGYCGKMFEVGGEQTHGEVPLKVKGKKTLIKKIPGVLKIHIKAQYSYRPWKDSVEFR